MVADIFPVTKKHLFGNMSAFKAPKNLVYLSHFLQD